MFRLNYVNDWKQLQEHWFNFISFSCGFRAGESPITLRQILEATYEN